MKSIRIGIAMAVTIVLIAITTAGCSGNESAQIDNTSDAKSTFIYGLKLEADAMQSASQTELHFLMAQDLGLGFVKVVVPMDMIVNPTTGGWNWALTDQIAAFAQKYGISLIPMFLSSDDPVKQRDAAAFAQFAFNYVVRYRDSEKIEYVEFQNEPNQFNDGTGWKGPTPVPPGSWQGTAAQLVAVDNAAYDLLKAAFPGLIVGSPGFISESNQALATYTVPFLNRYFAAQPKFDVFMYHYYPKNSSYAQEDPTIASLLASGWRVFEGYRSLLEQMGYGAKPIFVSEGHVDTPALVNGTKVWNWVSEDMASTLWVERFLRVLASSNASNVAGHVFSGAWGSGSETLVDSATGYKRKQYFVVKLLLDALRRFPIYSRKIAGAANDGGYWIEEFNDAQGKRMWVCLNPILYQTTDELQMPAEMPDTLTWTYPQSATLDVSPAAAVKISTTSGTQFVTAAGGSVTLTIGVEPTIVEESN